MYINGNIAVTFDKDGKFVDLFDRENNILGTDYSCLDREMLINNNTIEIGEKKKRIQAVSIKDLRIVFEQLLSAVYQIYGKYNIYIDYGKLNSELLVNQLIFDILFDKYSDHCLANKMTKNKYSEIISLKFGDINLKDNINKIIERSMKQNYQMMKSPQLREELLQLGVYPDNYDKYFTPVSRENISKKKPKYVWDHLFYNHYMITYKQYRRQLTMDSHNYSYETFFEDLDQYNKFVEILLPVDNESPEKYFYMTMDYYHLEFYKKIDFIFKLISNIPESAISNIDKEHYLVKYFHPIVLVPIVNDNKLVYTYKAKYYKMLFFIEEMLYQQMKGMSESELSDSDFGIQLFNYQLMRAKAYELFKYHYEFVSSDYRDIKKFISQCYNMRTYHDSNEVWKMIKGKEWKYLDVETKRDLKKLIKKFISVNSALFWKSSKREYGIPK